MNDNLAETTIEILAKSVQPWYSINLRYHNIEHVKEMLKQTSQSSCAIAIDFPEIDWEILVTSILWHDAGYKPGYELNEFEAAELYRRYYGSDAKKEVIDAILSTVPFYDKGFSTPEQQVLHDLDWFGFMSYEKMVSNECKIIAEVFDNIGLPQNLIKEKQLRFYKRIVDEGKPLYVTPLWSEYNDSSFANIRKRIEELENEGVGF